MPIFVLVQRSLLSLHSFLLEVPKNGALLLEYIQPLRNDRLHSAVGLSCEHLDVILGWPEYGEVLKPAITVIVTLDHDRLPVCKIRPRIKCHHALFIGAERSDHHLRIASIRYFDAHNIFAVVVGVNHLDLGRNARCVLSEAGETSQQDEYDDECSHSV